MAAFRRVGIGPGPSDRPGTKRIVMTKERKLPMPDADDPTLDETTSW